MRQIMGIQVGNRESDALKVQELLTKNGCIIKILTEPIYI